MTKPAARAFLLSLLMAAAGQTVQAQSRTAALGVQVEVLPTCAISVGQTGTTARARLSCAGRPQPNLRATVTDAPGALVQLEPIGRGRSAADVPLPDGAGTRLLTIQF